MKLSGKGYIIAVLPKVKKYDDEDGDEKPDFKYSLVEVAGMGFCETVFTTEEGIEADEEKLVLLNFELKKGRLSLKSVEDLPEKTKK